MFCECCIENFESSEVKFNSILLYKDIRPRYKLEYQSEYGFNVLRTNKYILELKSVSIYNLYKSIVSSSFDELNKLTLKI